jgi:hypothetical protein
VKQISAQENKVNFFDFGYLERLFKRQIRVVASLSVLLQIAQMIVGCDEYVEHVARVILVY